MSSTYSPIIILQSADIKTLGSLKQGLKPRVLSPAAASIYHSLPDYLSPYRELSRSRTSPLRIFRALGGSIYTSAWSLERGYALTTSI